MSSFDDEFGLFGEEGEEAERRSTLGARNIATGETIIDDIEPEDEAPRRRTAARPPGGGGRKAPMGKGRRFEHKHREPADPEASRARAAALIEFLTKKLVDKPDAVLVDNFPAENGEQASIEVIVDPEDIGKVIGRNGRVAQALRTIVRAAAEGRVGVEIFDTNDLNDSDEEGANEDEVDAD